MHVVWLAEKRADCLLVTAELAAELKHIKAMLDQGFTEEEIVDCWHDAIRYKHEYAKPRFLSSKIGNWKANKLALANARNNGNKPPTAEDDEEVTRREYERQLYYAQMGYYPEEHAERERKRKAERAAALAEVRRLRPPAEA